ncbi:MAG: sigma-70 family RNA polymerase sigma factor [Oscillospiraceae bacterium]|nr:sigma-70 family RNA polymerase sigma factor [Oscillospiraceae bacterium]MBQ8196338.1 sigma-70 family RNA polymerase sigma factor [Oscillospiraceae bacterium]
MHEGQLTEYIRRYGSTVMRAAYSYVKNIPDSEDIMQEVFLRLMELRKPLSSEEHIKAWLIRAAINLAKDRNRSVWHKNRGELTEDIPAKQAEDNGLSEALDALDGKYRIVVYLHYYEGYSVNETARLLKLTEANVKTRLKRAREKLRAFLTDT